MEHVVALHVVQVEVQPAEAEAVQLLASVMVKVMHHVVAHVAEDAARHHERHRRQPEQRQERRVEHAHISPAGTGGTPGAAGRTAPCGAARAAGSAPGCATWRPPAGSSGR